MEEGTSTGVPARPAEASPSQGCRDAHGAAQTLTQLALPSYHFFPQEDKAPGDVQGGGYQE